VKDLEILKTNNAYVGQLVSLITQVPEVDSLETSDIDTYQYGLGSENTQLHLVAMGTSYLNTNLYLNLQNLNFTMRLRNVSNISYKDGRKNIDEFSHSIISHIKSVNV